MEKKLGVAISDRKIKFQPASKGIDFLGYYVKPDYTLVRRKVVSKFKRKIKNQNYRSEQRRLSAINSYFGHFMHANTYNLRKKLSLKILASDSKNFCIKGEYNYLKLDK